MFKKKYYLPETLLPEERGGFYQRVSEVVVRSCARHHHFADETGIGKLVA